MKNVVDLNVYGWQASQWHEGLSLLAKKVGFLNALPEPSTKVNYFGSTESTDIHQWMHIACHQLELENEAITLAYTELEQHLQRIAPAIIQLPSENAPRLLFIAKSNKKELKIITPERQIKSIPIEKLRNVLRNVHELT